MGAPIRGIWQQGWAAILRSLIGDSSSDPIVYYVNGTTGDDSYDGLAAVVGGGHGPKKTWAAVEAILPFFMRRDYIVSIAAGTYAECCNPTCMGPGSLTILGGVTVEHIATITSLVNAGLNPCGFYQMTFTAWDGGFNLTDNVDDEKFLRVAWGDGTYQIFNIQSVLSSAPGANVAEVGPYVQNGKVIGDYAGKTVELITPSAIFQPATMGTFQYGVCAPKSVILGQRPAVAPYASSIQMWGITFDGSLTNKYALYAYEMNGRVQMSFCRFLGGPTGYASMYFYRSPGYFASTSSFYLCMSSAAAALLPALTDGCLRSSSVGGYSIGIVTKMNPAQGACFSVSSCNGAYFFFLGMLKGYARTDQVQASQFIFNVTLYPSSVMAFQFYESTMLLRLIGLIRNGHITAWGCTFTRDGSGGTLEMRGITTGTPLTYRNVKDDGAKQIAHHIVVSCPTRSTVLDASDCDITRAGDLNVQSMATLGAPLRLTRVRLASPSGTYTFPVQDYGANTGSGATGIIAADDNSLVKIAGTVTGQNTQADLTKDDPVSLRRGSSLTVAAGYNLLDSAGAKTVFLGGAGNGIPVPASGSSATDIQELVRVSQL